MQAQLTPRRLRRSLAAAIVAASVVVAILGLASPRAGHRAARPHRVESRLPAPPGPPPPPAVPRGPGHLVVRIVHATFMGPRPGVPSIARLLPRTEMGSPRVLPVVRRRGQWLGVLAEERSNGHVGWIHLDTNLRLSRVQASVEVSLGRRTLVVRRSGHDVASVRVAVGAPRTPTPTGRFGVTDRLRSHGPSVYGCCVLALSGHQPYIEPGWTGGNRIAIHSTFETSAIGQAVSHGCVRVDEATMRRLLSLVPLGAIVTIRR